MEIITERLRLEEVTPDLARLLITDRLDRVEELIGAPLPADFPTPEERVGHYTRHLQLMQAHPERKGWFTKLAFTKEPRRLIGHVGYHGPPEVIGRAEIGYTIFAADRGRGFAKEAARGLVQWALENGVGEVYASVRPDNAPSLAVIRALGFEQVGEQIDEVDGLELVFAVKAAPPS
ncbi:MAG TPA: GNAT family protein [Candidatus Dormibacteraeota bacterium]